MKTKIAIRKILTSNWFLAIFPSLLLIFFLPPFSTKYKLTINPARNYIGQYIYSDLNSDNISEMIVNGKGIPFYYIDVLNNAFRIYDQWNLDENLNPQISEIFFGNIDHDLYKEIFVFTYKNDSLFLNINEFFDPKGIKQKSIYITKIGFKKGELTSFIKPVGFYDQNNDGFDEIYFLVITAFGQPRKIYFYNHIDKILKISQFTGNIYANPKLIDSDGDSIPEIFGGMNALGNYSSNVPFSDSSTWLMIFNEKLDFEFPPVEFPGFANNLEIAAYQNKDFKGYVLSQLIGSSDTSKSKSRIMLYSIDGKLIRYRLLSELGFTNINWLFVCRDKEIDRIFLFEKKIIELNEKLEVIKTIDLHFQQNGIVYKIDIDANEKDEFLIYSDEEQKLLIYNNDLDKIAETNFKTKDIKWSFYQYLQKDQKPQLFLRTGDDAYYLRLNINNIYYLSYLRYPGIYFLFLFFIMLIRKINTRQVEQKERIKQRLLSLQLQGIKLQLDPHFTFNVLNSVSSMIYRENRDSAYDYLNKFTRLLRCMLNDTERIYRSLEEELEFVKTYLELEKLRFGRKFNYFIENDEGLDMKVQVPKMVIQTFAENAIKHGLIPCEDDGILKIILEKEMNYLKLTIEDNGIGRVQAAGKSNSTGKGLKITDEFYDLLNQLNKKPIRHIITDLYSESGNPTGTRVEVWVPFVIN